MSDFPKVFLSISAIELVPAYDYSTTFCEDFFLFDFDLLRLLFDPLVLACLLTVLDLDLDREVCDNFDLLFIVFVFGFRFYFSLLDRIETGHGWLSLNCFLSFKDFDRDFLTLF